jgi:hypothetical protein
MEHRSAAARHIHRSLAGVAGLVCALGWSAPAAAQVSGDGTVVGNDYALDLFQGPVLAPIRVTSMGGAYAGYAEGIAGFVSNAASPAVREFHSSGWLDADIDASISIPIPLFDNNDFDNSGDLDSDYSNFIYLSAGGQIQLGDFGTGFFGDLQSYSLSFGPNEPETTVTIGRYHLLVAWQLLGGQLVAGAGARALTLGVDAPDVALTIAGVAPQLGFLVRPDWMPFRVGATYRFAVDNSTSVGSGASVDTSGIERAGPLITPDSVELPWELEVGAALQVGPRPLNPSWIDPDSHEQELRSSYRQRGAQRRARHAALLERVGEASTRAQLQKRLAEEEAVEARRDRERLERDLERLRDERRARAANWPREYLLLTADLLVTGSVDNAISLERFLGQAATTTAASQCLVVASGDEINFSPRVGLEVEPLPTYVHTRVGSYYEPNRFRYAPEPCNERVGRQHFTFGADVRLFTTTWFGLVPEVTYKLQGYGDLAPRYQSFGLGIGVWR